MPGWNCTIRSLSVTIALLFLTLFAVQVETRSQGTKKRLANAGESQQASGKRVALVLGNAAYNPGKLKNPVNDANDMAAFLTSAGFEVIRKTDLGQDGMEAAIQEFGKKIKGAQVALFYYSGHGVQSKEVNYLIPTDVRIRTQNDLSRQAVAVNDILEMMEEAKSSTNIVLLDACRDNPFEATRGLNRGLAAMSAPDGTLIAFATAPGKTADDNPDGRNGLFTQELLTQLRMPGMRVTDALIRTRLAVRDKSGKQQTPWENSSLLEDFVFLGGKPAPIKPVVTPSRKPVLQDGAELVYIPAGEFTMGSTEYDNEKPVHRVTLDAYYIYKTPVTVRQYKQYCAATGKQMPPAPDFDLNWSKEDHPIVNVSWDDAQAYCAWVGASLPTEAQWEKAARGSDGRKFPWGNTFDGNKCANSVAPHHLTGTMPVGSFPSGASPYGVLDMAGNVWQWCSDWYGKNYYSTSHSGNPAGPATGSSRVFRGGSCFYNNVYDFRCANRNWLAPADGGSGLGFRCVVLADSE